MKRRTDKEAILFIVNRTLDNAREKLDAFKIKLNETPRAMGWSDDAFKAAAKIAVLDEISNLLRNDEMTIDEMHKIVETRITDGARWPSRSTSPIGDFFEQEKLAVWGKIFASLNGENW